MARREGGPNSELRRPGWAKSYDDDSERKFALEIDIWVHRDDGARIAVHRVTTSRGYPRHFVDRTGHIVLWASIAGASCAQDGSELAHLLKSMPE